MRALKIATPRAAENQTRITILVAPRPAYGLEYAGNTALNQTTTFVVRAWQPGSKTLIVVGQANSPSGIRAFRWAAGGGVSLGTLPRDFNSYAYDASSDRLTIVGDSQSYTRYKPFRWTAAGGM